MSQDSGQRSELEHGDELRPAEDSAAVHGDWTQWVQVVSHLIRSAGGSGQKVGSVLRVPRDNGRVSSSERLKRRWVRLDGGHGQGLRHQPTLISRCSWTRQGFGQEQMQPPSSLQGQAAGEHRVWSQTSWGPVPTLHSCPSCMTLGEELLLCLSSSSNTIRYEFLTFLMSLKCVPTSPADSTGLASSHSRFHLDTAPGSSPLVPLLQPCPQPTSSQQPRSGL